eukprot:Gb_07129 [translate_table: standard]
MQRNNYPRDYKRQKLSQIKEIDEDRQRSTRDHRTKFKEDRQRVT